MRSLTQTAVLLLLLVVSAAPVAIGATITGRVTGPDGTPFQGAFVEARNTASKITTDVLSQEDGTYEVPDLAAGQYLLEIRAVGFRATPASGITVTAGQNANHDFTLQKATVRWGDLSAWQGKTLLPEGTGKEMLFGGANGGGGVCFACHQFQSRMASRRLDQEGWMDLVNFMRHDAVPYFVGPAGLTVSDQKAQEVASYLTQVFGEDSKIPESPADLPEYKKTVRPFSKEALNIVYVVYPVPEKRWLPFQVYPPVNGDIWAADYGDANRVVRIDAKSGESKTYEVPCAHASGLHSAEVGPNGVAWFASQGCNVVASVDPRTGEVKQYQDAYTPGKEWGIRGGSKHDSHPLLVDGKLYVFSSGNPGTRLDPATGKFTPIEGVQDSYDVYEDKVSGNLWFTDISTNGTLREVDPRTLKILLNFAPPQDPANFRSHRIAFDSKGVVWVTCRRGMICRLDPKTKAYKEYTSVGPDNSNYAIAVDAGDKVWTSMSDLDELQRLDPATGKILEYPFPYPEITMRKFWRDGEKIWWASPANGVVGYFYLADSKRAK